MQSFIPFLGFGAIPLPLSTTGVDANLPMTLMIVHFDGTPILPLYCRAVPPRAPVSAALTAVTIFGVIVVAATLGKENSVSALRH